LVRTILSKFVVQKCINVSRITLTVYLHYLVKRSIRVSQLNGNETS